MPPILALLLGGIFVVLLLRYDHKISGAQSWAVWIPTFWMIRCASVPFDTWFDIKTYRELGASVESGNPFDRNILSVLILLGLVTIIKRKVDLLSVIRNNKWLFILTIFMLVSVSWSDFALVSLRRWFKVSGSLVMALVVLTEKSPIRTVESILRRTVYVTVPLSLIMVKYYPVFGVDFGRYSGEVSWAGVTAGKNTLGLLCVVAVMTWIKDWTNQVAPAARAAMLDKGALVGLLGATLWLLKGPGGAYSATSLINLGLAIPLFFALRTMRSANRVVSACAIVAAVVVLVTAFTQVVLGTSIVEIVAPLVGRDPSLTGRTETIWQPLMAKALERPIAGVGYGGFWIFPIVLDKFSINQAHNGYLDIFIELGAIGLLLFSLVVIEFLVKASKHFQYDPHWGAFLVTFLTMSLLHNYTESSYLKSTALLWAMFCMLTISASVLRQRSPLAEESIAGDHLPQLVGRESTLVRRTRKWSRTMLERRDRLKLRRKVVRRGALRVRASRRGRES
jgi:O-antigen ligase